MPGITTLSKGSIYAYLPEQKEKNKVRTDRVTVKSSDNIDPKRRKVVTFVVQAELYEELKEAAAKQGEGVGTAIQKGIKLYLERSKI